MMSAQRDDCSDGKSIDGTKGNVGRAGWLRGRVDFTTYETLVMRRSAAFMRQLHALDFEHADQTVSGHELTSDLLIETGYRRPHFRLIDQRAGFTFQEISP